MPQSFDTTLLILLNVMSLGGYCWIGFTVMLCVKDVRRELDALATKITALEARYSQSNVN